MIRLWDVGEVMMQDTYEMPTLTEQVLYDLLLERPAEANISHSTMPTITDHCGFVRSMPYKHWYLIQDWGEHIKVPEWVGAIYISRQDEIGIAIFKEHQGKGFGSEAVKQLMVNHPGKLYANIAPTNQKSIEFFKRFGAKHIQNTFVLGG